MDPPLQGQARNDRTLDRDHNIEKSALKEGKKEGKAFKVEFCNCNRISGCAIIRLWVC